jgi:asparagine synthase (glutamine-hydrolysing)
MCGICGLWLRGEHVSPQTLVRMRETLAHRGPDGASGVLLPAGEGQVPVRFEQHPPDGTAGHRLGFGHRRLAIIDIPGGAQPMASDDESVWLNYNGEIYNYRELRAQLRAAGHRFATESDTEVLLRAYEQYGPRCVEHLNGIYAFAVWDARVRRLLLARDPFGVKPLYYACTPQGFAFGSEVKAILASGLVAPALDLDALGLSLMLRYTPSPATLFEHVRRLAPGTSLTVTEARAAEPEFFAAPAGRGGAPEFFASPAGLDSDPEAPWPERLADAIERAVRRQLVSDVPVGLSLSSGVDSATLLSVMSAAASEPVRAFTIGFAGASGAADEVPGARALARRCGARFADRELGPGDYAAQIDRYMWHLEEPLGNESALAYMAVAQLAREAGVTVLLTGQGADELFAGYDRHAGIAFARWLAPASTPWARAILGRATRGRPLGEKYRRLLQSAAGGDEARALLGAYASFGAAQLRALLRPEVHEAIDWEAPLRHVERWLARAPAGTALERMLWVDARTVLADNLLLAEDKLGMAASVEARMPLLDLQFARLAEAVPGSRKLLPGARKHVYRSACARFVGVRQSRRRQIGFANPMAQWLRGAEGRELLAGLERDDAIVAVHMRPEAIRALVREHADGAADNTRTLFYLASLEAWSQAFLARR